MTSQDQFIHVVAAVIENTDGKILIAKRPQHVHQGGLWEFPGGKVEQHETPENALKRELFEELNIQTEQTQPVIQIRHQYTDKSIFLDVRRVKTFKGTAIGNEDQAIKWVDKNSLSDFDFPVANKAIVDAVQLPREYLITPEHKVSERAYFLNRLELKLKNGIKLVQLRAKSLSQDEYAKLYAQVKNLTNHFNVMLLANTSIEHAFTIGATGIHLNSTILLNTHTKLPAGIFSAASCHNETEIMKANKLGVTFVVISPVQFTQSHPHNKPLGWKTFSTLCQHANMPVYALGGMTKADCLQAIECGAQGIAGISNLWHLKQ